MSPRALLISSCAGDERGGVRRGTRENRSIQGLEDPPSPSLRTLSPVHHEIRWIKGCPPTHDGKLEVRSAGLRLRRWSRLASDGPLQERNQGRPHSCPVFR